MNSARCATTYSALLLCAGLGTAVKAQEAFQLRELVSERHIVFQGGYFPRLILLDNGHLLATFKYGAAHIGKTGKAGLVRSTDRGKSWSDPVPVFDMPAADDGVIASAQLSDGVIVLGAVSYTWSGEKYTMEGWKATPYSIRSEDGGETWSEPSRIDTHPYTWAYPFGNIVEEDDGTLLMAAYGGYLPRGPEDQPGRMKELEAAGAQPAKPANQRGDFSFVVRSRDRGRTWGEPALVAAGFNETSLLPLEDGRVLAVMRSQDEAYLATSVSPAGGRAWSLPQRITEAREHPGDLLRLSSGAILLTFGQRNKPFGVQAMLSRDEGRTWDTKERIMLASDGDHADIGYPVTVQRDDGRLVTIYYVVYGERDTEGTKGIAPLNAFTKVVIWTAPEGW